MILSMLEIALRALLVAATVWAGLRLLGVRDVLAQKVAWGLVLAAAIVMPLALPVMVRWQILPAGFAVSLPWKSAAAAPSGMPAPALSFTEHSTKFNSAPQPASLPPASVLHSSNRVIALEPISPLAAASSTTSVSAGSPATSGTRSTIEIAPPMERAHAAPAPMRLPNWRTMLWTIYFAVCAILLLRILFGLASALSLWLDAKPVTVESAANLCVRSSRAISSPVTIGSGIVLPAGYDEWDIEKLRIVLAHERSHIRQGDFYLQLVAGIYAAMFWFSPLGWWLKRTLSDLGEAISDRAGLEEAASRSSYAQVLLEFAARPRPNLIGVAMARSSSLSHRIERLLNDSSFRQAFSASRSRAMAAVVLVPVAFFAATTLLRVEAAGSAKFASAGQSAAPSTSTSTTSAAQSSSPSTSQSASPSKTPQAAQGSDALSGESNPTDVIADDQDGPALTPVAPIAPVTGVTPLPTPPTAYAPIAPRAPIAVLVPRAGSYAPLARGLYGITVGKNGITVGRGASLAIAQASEQAAKALADASRTNSTNVWTLNGKRFYLRSGSGRGFAYAFRNDDEDSYALVTGPADSVRFGGDWMDGRKREIEKASKAAHGKFLWFEHDDKSYVIDDPAIIANIEAMYKPMDDLDRQQEELGKKQDELGRQQDELGKKQEQASIPTPDVSKEIAELNAAIQKLQTKKAVTQDELGELQEKIGDLQGRIGDIEGKIGEAQGKLGEEQGKLGEQQGRLGEEQGRLGEQQGRLAEEADHKIRSIIDESLKNGKARPVE